MRVGLSFKCTICTLTWITENLSWFFHSDGPDALGVFCGHVIAARLASTGNRMRIVFETDYSVTYTGFSIRWQGKK